MTGDPRVLAPLQQAYLAAGDMNTRFSIRQSWRHETGVHGEREETDAAIRAWKPTPAEPSLEQRVAELTEAIEQERIERKYAGRRYVEMITAVIARIDSLHPEPTAPDDPVCANPKCGHPKSSHNNRMTACFDRYCYCTEFIPAPQPAPDLDPVRVEAAAKTAWEDGGRMTSWDEASADIHELWIRDAGLMITTYLKDGGA